MADDLDGRPDSTLQLALDRFKLSSEAESRQREQELDDLEFVDEEKQWDPEVEKYRAAQSFPDGTVQAARPCLVISKLIQPLQQMANQRRAARLQLQFSPKGNGASREVAEVYEDLARAIQVDSRADIARNWAADRADKCGRGFYRLLTQYCYTDADHDGQPDLEIRYKRIPNQFSVYLDPFAQEPDWSDGEFAFITEDIPVRRFKREFKKRSQLAELSDDDLRGIGDEYPEWIKSTESTGMTVRVGEYYRVECEYDEDGKETNRQVFWHLMTCKEFIKSQETDIPYIPIIPVIGIETNVNGRRAWKGLVRSAKDAQRSYNWMRSTQVETIAMAPKAPWIMEEGQIEGHEDMWRNSAVRQYPALIYKGTNLLGTPAPPPQRTVQEPAIQAITLAAQTAERDVQSVTGFHAPALGENERDRSGKAIQALQKQAEIGASGYLDNLVSISMAYEGKVLRAWIPKVYDRPGRIITVIGADDQRRSIILGTPFTEQNGSPEPVDLQGMPPGVVPQGVQKPINLADGEYSVQPTVGKAHSTRREEAVAMVGELLQAAPQLTPMVADILVDNMDIPGGKQIADRLKKALPPQLQEDGQSAELQLMQAQQQLAQAGQMMQMMSKELEQKTRIIETDGVKQEYETRRSLEDNNTKIRIAEIQANTQFGVAELKAGLDTAKMRLAHIEALLGHQAEAQQLESEQAHDAQQMEANRQAEAQGAQADRDAQAMDAERGRQHDSVEGARARQHEREQADRDREQETMMTIAGQEHEAQLARQQAAQKPQAGA